MQLWIVLSNIKNTGDAIKYCMLKGYDYNLISSRSYRGFLLQLSKNKSFVFLPKTPETLSRIIVEARMMNMGVITNKLIGAASEPWYRLKGEPLIEVMIKKREQIVDIVFGELKVKVYCVKYSQYAGKWIYDGYSSAWEKTGL